MAHMGPTPFRFGKLFYISQKSYFVLPNSCHCHFCSTLFWQLLLLQRLVAFNKTVYKMYFSISTFVSFSHSHQFVFDIVWFLSCGLLLHQNLTSQSFEVYYSKGLSKQSQLISWVGASVDLCCFFAKKFSP